MIVHLGSHLGSGFEAGLERAAPVLERVLELAGDGTWLLLENTAGAGGTMGLTVEELALVIDRCGTHPWLGVCIDSCHLYASGVDVGDAAALDAMLDELDVPDRPRPPQGAAHQRLADGRSAPTAIATRASARG